MTRNRKEGFSLAEMGVVLMILAIIMLLLMPNIRHVQSAYALRQEKTLLISDLRLLQEKARATGQIGEWTYDKGHYQLALRNQEGNISVLFTRTLREGISLYCNSHLMPAVYFLPDGTSNFCTVQLQQESIGHVDIVIYHTGRIREGSE